MLTVVEVKDKAAHNGLKRSNLERKVLELDTRGSAYASGEVLLDEVVDHRQSFLVL